MRRPSWKWLRRIAIVGLMVGLAGPHVVAAYQYRAAHRDLARFHPAAARSRMETCLRTWPKSAGVRISASRAARQAGDLDDAAEQLLLARRLVGEPTDDLAFEWALLQASAGHVREVESYLQSQAERRPAESHLVWEALAEGYLRTFRTVDAMSCVEHWLGASPENVRALELRGQIYILGRGVKRGSDDFRRTLELDPTRDDTRGRLTRALLDLGAYGEAVPHLEHLMKSQPDDAEVPVRLARCFNMLDRKSEAQQLLRSVLDRHPEHGFALRALGQFALTDGNPAEAEIHLRKAAAALPADYQAHWLLYEAVRQQGKPDAAALLKDAEVVRDRSERIGELQSRRLAEQPLEPALHVEMALLLLQTGKDDIAITWLQSALSLDAKFRPAHRLLADLYSRKNQPDLAAAHRKLAEE